jgi:hypothetical protein
MYWIRELAGWVLVALGLFIFYVCVAVLLSEHGFLEAIFLTVIGVIVFRGGLHLIKVAVAGRVCREAQRATLEPPTRAQPGATGVIQKTRLRNLGKTSPT